MGSHTSTTWMRSRPRSKHFCPTRAFARGFDGRSASCPRSCVGNGAGGGLHQPTRGRHPAARPRRSPHTREEASPQRSFVRCGFASGCCACERDRIRGPLCSGLVACEFQAAAQRSDPRAERLRELDRRAPESTVTRSTGAATTASLTPMCEAQAAQGLALRSGAGRCSRLQSAGASGAAGGAHRRC